MTPNERVAKLLVVQDDGPSKVGICEYTFHSVWLLSIPAVRIYTGSGPHNADIIHRRITKWLVAEVTAVERDAHRAPEERLSPEDRVAKLVVLTDVVREYLHVRDYVKVVRLLTDPYVDVEGTADPERDYQTIRKTLIDLFTAVERDARAAR